LPPCIEDVRVIEKIFTYLNAKAVEPGATRRPPPYVRIVVASIAL
jgi:hypothetical protein